MPLKHIYSKEDSKVVEIEFRRGAFLSLQSHDLFEETDVIAYLMTFDPRPFDGKGVLVFFELGISISGFHDAEPTQEGISVFRKGTWDEFRETLTPFSVE